MSAWEPGSDRNQQASLDLRVAEPSSRAVEYTFGFEQSKVLLDCPL
jgi:hypothetical protein